jgi:predicted permease
MNWNDLVLRLKALRSPRRAERDLDDELQFHLEMEARKLRAAGMPADEALRRARVEFGGLDQSREECRDVRGVTFLENLQRDVRYGLRMLRKSPVFTTVAVLSLAIGIGANTAVFTLVDVVLLRVLPVRNPEQLVILKWGARKQPDINGSFSTGGADDRGRHVINVFSWRIFDDLRAHSRSLQGVFAFSPLGAVNVAAEGQSQAAGGLLVSGNYFQDLGVNALVGRVINADDEMAGGAPAAVISYRMWDTVYGLNPDVIGKTIYLNAHPCTIVGVAPKQFFGVSAGGFNATPRVDIMLPILAKRRVVGAGDRATDYFAPEQFWLQIMGRRNSPTPAIEAEVAATVVANLAEQGRREMQGEPAYGSVESGSQGLTQLRTAYRNPLLIVTAVVGLTLLMACANLAGLLLARATARQKEILLRLALGAKRSRLIRQLLVEGALLSAAGATAGLAVAFAGVRALLAVVATGTSPIMLQVTPDLRVLAFTIAVTALTAFLFALAPAIRATRVDVASGLKQDTPASTGHRFGAVRTLVAAQIAVAVLLVTGAILLVRTLENLRSVPLGFQAGNLVLFDIAPGRNGYDSVRGTQLYTRVIDRLNETTGVVGATLSSERLLSGWISNGSVRIEGRQRGAQSTFNFVGADFFEVMQIPLVAGRGLRQSDMAPAQRVAVVNEAFVRRHFRGEAALGRRFRWPGQPNWDVEIVGIARDARYDKLRGESPATIYVPYTQRPFGWPDQLAVEVRTAGNSAAAVSAVRRVMREIDPMLPLMDLKTQKAQIDDMLVQERLFASLVSLFGAITLALACVGLYGLVAASVAARTREIGVRMALGAGRASVLRMLLAQVALIAAVGLGAGLLAAWMAMRVVASQLYGVQPHDPLTFALAIAGVLLVSVGAALIPARRATRIDPVRALRYE